MARGRVALDPVVDTLHRGCSVADVRQDLKAKGNKSARISQLLRQAGDVLSGSSAADDAAAKEPRQHHERPCLHFC